MINNSFTFKVVCYYNMILIYIKPKCVLYPAIRVILCVHAYCAALAADVIRAIDRSRGVIAQGSGVSVHTRASNYDACVQLFIIIYNNLCVKKAADTCTTKFIII